MNRSPEPQRWIDLATKRTLTGSEVEEIRAWLEANPQSRASLEEDLRLSRLLQQASSPKVASNFTARVLEQVQHEPAGRAVHGNGLWLRGIRRWRLGWRMATAAGALALMVVVVQIHQRNQSRVELAQGMAALPLEALADVEFWRDFAPIQALPSEPLPRVAELVAALE
ncbi:MAG: hypothetical protein ACYDC1_13900 [Limisphaerales bacterium]